MIINIYHTNDIHSNYNFVKKVNNYLKENKQENDLYFDSGDYTDLKDLVVESDRGQSAVQILNQGLLDGITFGNNEIDLGHDDLSKITKYADYICCNVTDNDGNKIDRVLDYKIIKKANVRFLITGIAPYYNTQMQDNNFNGFFRMYNLQVQPSIATIQNILKENAGKYDYAILLSHSGIIQEEYFIKHIKGFNLILGGHSHSIVNYPGYSQSGKGETLGKITLEIKDGQIKEIASEQIQLEEVEDNDFDELLEQHIRKADEILSEPLEAISSLSYNPFDQCQLVNFICDAMLKEYGGDFAIMHNGIASNSLELPISRKTLLTTLPSKLNPTSYFVSGENILKAIQLSLDQQHIQQSGAEAGFRGHVLGTLSFSHNVHLQTTPLKVFINNQPLQLGELPLS